MMEGKCMVKRAVQLNLVLDFEIIHCKIHVDLSDPFERSNSHSHVTRRVGFGDFI